MDVPLHKYWGDMSPLSHRDRRPWFLTSDLDLNPVGPVVKNHTHAKNRIAEPAQEQRVEGFARGAHQRRPQRAWRTTAVTNELREC